MKNIIVFINSMTAPGGIERVVSNLLKEWVKEYHIILLVKDDKNASFYDVPGEVERASINEPLMLDMHDRKQRILAVFNNAVKSHEKLKRFLKNTNYDYIYTTTPLNSLEVYFANPKARNKLVISEHASAYAMNGIYQKIKKFVYPKARVISVPNRMDCDVYNSWGGYEPFTFLTYLHSLRSSRIRLIQKSH